MLVMAVHAVRSKPFKWEKALMLFFAVSTLFVLLEEIDYGLHFYEFIAGGDNVNAAQVRNFHNIGERADIIKLIANIGMGLFFFFFPLFMAKNKNHFIRYFLPDCWFVGTIISMIVISRFAHFLRNAGLGQGGVISKNISKFRELTVYYIFMVYTYDLVYKRTFDTGRIADRKDLKNEIYY